MGTTGIIIAFVMAILFWYFVWRTICRVLAHLAAIEKHLVDLNIREQIRAQREGLPPVNTSPSVSDPQAIADCRAIKPSNDKLQRDISQSWRRW